MESVQEPDVSDNYKNSVFWTWQDNWTDVTVYTRPVLAQARPNHKVKTEAGTKVYP